MNCKEIQEIIELYIAGEIDLQKKNAVESHIATCKTCFEIANNSRNFLQKLEKDMEMLLYKPNKSSQDEMGAVYAIEGHIRRKENWQTAKKSKLPFLSAAAAILLVLATALLLFIPSNVEYIAQTGDRQIKKNEVVASSSAPILVTMDSKDIEIKPNSLVKFLDNHEIELNKGSVNVDVKKISKFSVKTNIGTATVQGTKFEVLLSDKMTVRVFVGTVRVHNSHGSIEVTENEVAIVEEKSKPKKDKLEELKMLIAKLNEIGYDQKILKLVRQESNSSETIKPLLTEIKRAINEEKDLIKEKLQSITAALEQGKWTKISNAPIDGRTKCTALPIGDRFIIWGGYNDESKKMYKDGAIYDISKNSWFKMANCPIEPRVNHSAAIADNKLFIWGGCNDKREYFNDGAVYNISDDSWTKINPCPLGARILSSAAAFGNKLLVWGGIKEKNNKYTNDGALYDITNNTWTTTGTCPIIPRKNYVAVSSGSKFLVWGGTKGDGGEINYADGAVYDISNDSWKKMNSSPLIARSNHVAAVIKDKLLIWGGQGAQYGPVNYYDGAIYDITSDKWTKMKEIHLEDNGNYMPYFFGNNLVVWDARKINNGAVYDMTNNSWTRIKPMTGGNNTGRSFLTLVPTQDKLIIWGGSSNYKFHNDGEIYELPLFTPTE